MGRAGSSQTQGAPSTEVWLYFWRIGALKSRLIEGRLADREAVSYVTATFAMTSLVMAFPPASPNTWDTAMALVGCIVVVLGIWWAYRQNWGAAGADFVHRYLSLAWVLTIRILAPLVAVALLLEVLRAGEELPPAESGPGTALIALLLGLLFYQRLGAHVRDVAQATTGTSHHEGAPGPSGEHD
jgi:hypothetical protein